MSTLGVALFLFFFIRSASEGGSPFASFFSFFTLGAFGSAGSFLGLGSLFTLTVSCGTLNVISSPEVKKNSLMKLHQLHHQRDMMQHDNFYKLLIVQKTVMTNLGRRHNY